MPIIESKGAASAQGFGEFAKTGTAVYIEDVFSTYLYTGNGSTQTITNGIDLAGKGGMVWGKSRSNPEWHSINDTVRGPNKTIQPNNTNAESSSDLTAFTSSGFSLGYITGSINGPGQTEVSWTFRKQPKFFDVVTYTGTGANRTIAHSLGSTPGCIIVKRTNAASDWQVYHRSLTSAAYSIQLNQITAETSTPTVWNSTAPTSTVFSVGTDASVNASGGTYVAYIFAHNAGGFGLTGTDNVISCGSFTTSGTFPYPASATLGYEPQWVIVKPLDYSGQFDWQMYDSMRGMSLTGGNRLLANTSDAEAANYDRIRPNATGFDCVNFPANGTFIYIAIRRGPMKVPTDGTSVFTPAIGTTDYTGPQFDATFPRVDSIFEFFTTGGGVSLVDRLRGDTQRLKTYSTAAEVSSEIPLDMMYGAGDGGSVYDRAWMFGRAPGFFDEVCYTGTGVARTVNHNLGVAPELMIVKKRSSTSPWTVWNTTIAAINAGNYLYLNQNYDLATLGTDTTNFNNTSPTSSVFTVGSGSATNGLGTTLVAYLFASCPNVSKVTNFTGNGSTQTINCGFTTGARFVLIKATSTTGNWLVFDTARGMTTSTDPWLALNSTAAESATTGACTTTSVGFTVDESKLTGVNTNGVSYIAFAVA